MLERVFFNVFGSTGREISFKVHSSGNYTKNHYIADYLGSVRLVFDDDGNRTARYDYRAFGEQIIGSTGDERSDWLSKEKDRESNLRDHGVRKYDEEIGRFTSIDPLWDKYLSLTPYQYAGNNPVNAVDFNGKEIILMNLNNSQKQQWNSHIATLRSFNSSVVNNILDLAEGPSTKIHVYFLPGIRPVSTETKSEFGNYILESYWNSKEDAFGMAKQKSYGFGDIMIDSDAILGNMLDNGEVNLGGISLLGVIDELNHILSNYVNVRQSTNDKAKELYDHKSLWESLKKEDTMFPKGFGSQLDAKLKEIRD